MSQIIQLVCVSTNNINLGLSNTGSPISCHSYNTATHFYELKKTRGVSIRFNCRVYNGKKEFPTIEIPLNQL